MEDIFEQLKRHLTHIRLSEAEREHMRGVLSEYVAHKPPVGVTEPFLVYRSWFAVHRFAAVVAVALVVMLLGGTVSYAAGGSLPGDTLYSVKVGVNEPLADVFARTPKEKALREVEKVNRRLAEAETLVIQGRLDTSAREEVEALVAAHLAAVDIRVAEALEEMTGASNDVVETLSAALDVHNSILSSLGEDGTGDGREEVGALLTRVRAASVEEGRRVVEIPAAARVVTPPSGDMSPEEDEGGESADEKGRSTDGSELAMEIVETGEALDRLQENPRLQEDDTRILIQDEAGRLLDVADEALVAADAALADGRLEEAEDELTRAQRAMRRATVILHTAPRLPDDITLFPVRVPDDRNNKGLNDDGEVEGASFEKNSRGGDKNESGNDGGAGEDTRGNFSKH